MKRRSIATGFCLLVLLLATGARAEVPPLELELGFRIVNVDGNEDMYRTQINEDEGVLLRYFTLRSDDERGLFDYYRVDASDLGVGPAGMLRFEAGRANHYRTKLFYRRAESFSSLPAFANPLLGEGIIPGQHTWDRTRQTADIEFEYLALDHIAPFFGYTWSDYDGPGTTTYHAGQDEFLLNSDLQESGNEFRVGASFTWDRFYGSVTQGWRDFSGDERLTLSPGAGNGNNDGNVIDRPVSADSISRLTKVDVTAPFTNIFVTGVLTDRFKLTGKFVQFEADSDVSGDESMSGSFASFPVKVYFDGLSETVTSDAESDTTIAGIRGEWMLSDDISITAGYLSEERDLKGAGLVRTLYLNSMTFGGVDRGDLEVILNTNNSLDREEKTFDFEIAAHQLGPFGLWARYAQTDEEAEVAPDIAEIAVPGSQSGTFKRSIDTIEAGGNFSMSGFSVIASWRQDDADDPILRIDYVERERFRGRIAYNGPSDRFGISLSGETTDQSNDDPGFGYDSEIEQYTASAWVAFTEKIRIWGSASDFSADSLMMIRNPIHFTTTTSVHKEDGDATEGGITLVFDPIRIDASLSQFDNEGTRPFDVDRLDARITWSINDAFGLAAEWENDDYDEIGSVLADYEAERIGLYLRWTP